MIPVETLLDAFVNANILFCVAYLLCLGVREGMKLLGFEQAFGVQLRLFNIVFFSVILAPFVVLGFSALEAIGLLPNVKLNLSDAVVAHYLHGGFEMKAADLEGLILMRDNLLLNLSNGAGLVAQGLILIFLAGFAIGTIRLIYSVACLHRIVSHSYAWRRFGRVRIRLSDRTLVPFSTRGLWNYYVILPSSMLTQSSEMKVSLAHEFQHIRQGDLAWEIALELLKPLFFLNPCYHAWKRQVEELREFDCDANVLLKGRIDMRSYCETLLSVCQNSLRRDRAFVIAVPKVTLVTADRTSKRDGKMSLLEYRVLSALNTRRMMHSKLVLTALAVPLVLMMATTTIAIQRPGDWSHDRLMLSTVVNLERMDEINRLSTFGRIRN